MQKSAYDVEPMVAAAGVYRALTEAATLSAAGAYSTGRRGYRRASRQVRRLDATYRPRTVTAYRAMRGDLPAPRRSAPLIVTVTLLAAAGAGAGAAITALWVRRPGAAETATGSAETATGTVEEAAGAVGDAAGAVGNVASAVGDAAMAVVDPVRPGDVPAGDAGRFGRHAPTADDPAPR
jgi:hypothetical protein